VWRGEEKTFQFLVSIEKIRDLVQVREKNAHILTVRGMLPVRSFCVDVQLYGRGRRLFNCDAVRLLLLRSTISSSSPLEEDVGNRVKSNKFPPSNDVVRMLISAASSHDEFICFLSVERQHFSQKKEKSEPKRIGCKVVRNKRPPM
jgi:hypothetical protein